MVNPGTYDISIVRGIETDTIILQCRDDSVVVSGTLAPNVAGVFVPSGTYASYPLFILEATPSAFCYFHPIALTYVIAQILTDGSLTNYWLSPPGTTEPTASYAPQGANTGTAVATDHPVDLSGYGASAHVRRTVNATDVLIDLNPSITDPTTGEITIPALTSAQTLALPFTGKFMWDLVLGLLGNRFGPFIKGSYTVSDNITQQ
jgi:hypothetical protein